jgi:lysozyme
MEEMNMRMSREGLDRLTKPWEEYVGYPYDDKAGKVRNAQGKLVYPEWTGGPVRGTVTFGYGHTNAAGAPIIEPGMHLTEPMACTILLGDMAPCERRVNAALKVEVTQHQYDTICDLDFNCPSALPHVASLVNAGDWSGAERVMLQYIYSKGEPMVGLTHRRNAEIAWANTSDDPETVATTNIAPPSTVVCPKGERAPPPKTPMQSKTVAAARTVGAGGLLATLQSANDAAEPLKEAKQNLLDLGLFDQATAYLTAAAHSPVFWIGLVIAGMAVFIECDRRAKLRNDHV